MRHSIHVSLVALLIASCAPAPDVSPQGGPEANKAVVERFVQAMNARDFEALDDLVAPDVVRHSPSTPGVTVNSLDDFKEFLRGDFAAVPDSRQTIETMVAEGDRVAVRMLYEGTQSGPWGPFPPSGNRIELEFAGFLRVEDGRIAEIWAVWDNVDALTQLGHMAPPETGGA